MTANEQLAVLLPVIRKKLQRAKFLHEPWVTLDATDVELLTDAADEFLRDLILPGDESEKAE
jgi:hypothetical protein